MLPSTDLQYGPDVLSERSNCAEEARPTLWNLVVDPDGHVSPSHRPGCLPAPLLLACPAVAEVFLQQAVARAPQPASPRGLVARNTEALAFPSPLQGLSAVEAALLAEAAASPLWSMGPTDSALAFRRCAAERHGLAGAAQMQLQVCRRMHTTLDAIASVVSALSTHHPFASLCARLSQWAHQASQIHAIFNSAPALQVDSCMSAYAVAARTRLACDDVPHVLALELACSTLSMFDVPAILLVLTSAPERLFQLLDGHTATHEAVVDDVACSPGRFGPARHSCRPSRISCVAGAGGGGMHELPQWPEGLDPGWLDPSDEYDGLSLLLQPTDAAGALKLLLQRRMCLT